MANGEDNKVAIGEDSEDAKGVDSDAAKGDDSDAAKGDDSDDAKGEDSKAAIVEDGEDAKGDDSWAAKGDDSDAAKGDVSDDANDGRGVDGFTNMSTELESGFTNVMSVDLAGRGCRAPNVAKISFLRASAGLKTGLGGAEDSVIEGWAEVRWERLSERIPLVSSCMVAVLGTDGTGEIGVWRIGDCWRS